uniref:ATP-binding cassette domain-containing protein n=1 Tax=Salmonella enterica TaxID=28901 RepID=UPI003A8D74AB
MKRDLLRLLTPALVLMILSAVMEGICALLLASLVSRLQAPGHELLMLMIATVVVLLVQYIAATRGFSAGGAVVNMLVKALIVHVPRAVSPHKQAEGLLSGPIGQVMSAPAHLLAPLVSACITPLTIIGGLAIWYPGLALLLLCAVILIAFLLRISAEHLHKQELRLAAVTSDIYITITHFAHHQALLRSSDTQSSASGALMQQLDEHHRSHLLLLRRSLPWHLAFVIALQMLLFLTILFGGNAVMIQYLDIPHWLALIILLLRLSEPLLQLSHLDQAFRQLRYAFSQIQLVLSTDELPFVASDGPIPQDNSISIHGVTLPAQNGGRRLEGFNGFCAAGQMLAIVGPSGAGKSSLIQLISRMQDPLAGRIEYGGCDIRSLSIQQLAKAQGVLFQANRLLRGSVRWNLTQGRKDINNEQLESLLTALDLSPDILEEEVGTGGNRFSGGQKQRLCLARLLLHTPSLLLLDEPTASLDRHNANRVTELIRNYPGTRIVITHDPAMACVADSVWVLEDGKLTEAGSPVELCQRGGWFYLFCKDTDTSH